MIDRERLSEALEGLDARDRDLLEQSLRRRVSDDELAERLDTGPSEVAQRRAAVVEHLSVALGIQRGDDLGALLKELLEDRVWPKAPRAEGERGHQPLGATGSDRSIHQADESFGPTPVPPSAQQGEGDRAAAEGASSGSVLEMLSGRSETGGQAHGSPVRGRLIAALAIAVVMLVPATIVALTAGSTEGGAKQEASDDGTRPFAPSSEPKASEPFPSEPTGEFDYATAEVTETVALREKPGGKSKVRIRPRTDWNSRRIMSVVERRGDWMAVLAPELDNGEVGWVKKSEVARMGSVPWAVHVDLSKRRLEVRREGEVVRRIKVGIGRKDHPTPRGRYAVTDKLRVKDPGSPYGCCVVALTGHQTKLPPGWPGGDRLAVHATPDVSGIGKAVSLGCLRTDPRDTRWLMKTLPIGTPVFVRS